MGVKDLGTLAKKLAPSSITTVPNWTTFAGRKVAIDASLLTNRFHFGRPRTVEIGEDVVNGHHHARMWYRFLQTLRMYGVTPFVVFDGSTRLDAKAREVQRRRKLYNLVKARAKAEAERTDRLKEMKEVWDQVHADERQDVLAQLKAAIERVEKLRRQQLEDEAQAAAAGATAPDEEARLAADALTSDLRRLELELESAIPPSAGEESVKRPAASPSPPSPPSPPSTVAEQAPAVSLFDHLEDGPVKALAKLHEAQVADAGAAIYSRRQKSVTLEQSALFGILMETEEKKPSIADKAAAVDADTMAERLLEAGWPEADESVEVEGGLGKLLAKSTSLATDYKHSSFSVPAAALQTSRELVQAMGVPWLQPGPANPYEAEGVCSALYNAGLVDCVASEDTDVVVFGAPLLRNATTTENPKLPMSVLDPIELRKQLDMTKEQLVDLAILLGTDFTVRIPKLGPVAVIDLMRRYGKIEDIVVALRNEGYKGREYVPYEGDFDAYLDTVRIAREIYLSLPPMPPAEPIVSPHPGAPMFGTRAVDTGDASPEAPAWYGDLDPKPAADLDDVLVRFGIMPGETFEEMDALERYAAAQLAQPIYEAAFEDPEMPTYGNFDDEQALEAEFERWAELPDEPTAPREVFAEEEAVTPEVEQTAEVPDEPTVPREMDPSFDAEWGALYAEIGQVAVEKPADYDEIARRGRGRRRRGTARA